MLVSFYCGCSTKVKLLGLSRPSVSHGLDRGMVYEEALGSDRRIKKFSTQSLAILILLFLQNLWEVRLFKEVFYTERARDVYHVYQ